MTKAKRAYWATRRLALLLLALPLLPLVLLYRGWQAWSKPYELRLPPRPTGEAPPFRPAAPPGPPIQNPAPPLPPPPVPMWNGKRIATLGTGHLTSIVAGIDKGCWSWGDQVSDFERARKDDVVAELVRRGA